jgi:hypothetical protein
LPTALDVINTLCKESEGIGNPLTKVCYLQKLPILSEEFVRGLPAPFDTLEKICQRVANTFAKGLPTTSDTFSRGLPQYIQKCNLFATPLRKVKFKVKTNKQHINLTKDHSFITKYCSIYPYHQ